MKFINVPLLDFHSSYRPEKNDTMDMVESKLIVMACARKWKPNVLEIGTHYGNTTANIARVVKPLRGLFVTVDVVAPLQSLPKMQEGDVRPQEEIGKNVPEDLKDSVVQVMIDPRKPNSLSAALDFFDGRKWDVVFIDGDHSYEGVKNDYISIMKRVAPDGMILFHDVWWDVEPPPVDGPLRLMEELGGVVMNLTHLGILPEHIGNMERRML